MNSSQKGPSVGIIPGGGGTAIYGLLCAAVKDMVFKQFTLG